MPFVLFLAATFLLGLFFYQDLFSESDRFWPSSYFALLTVQWISLFLSLVLAYLRGSTRAPAAISRNGPFILFVLFNVLLAASFSLMGVSDAFVGMRVGGQESPLLKLAFGLVLVAVVALTSGLIYLARRLSKAWRLSPLAFASYLVYVYLLGALGYWALGWTLFFQPAVDEPVLLWSVGCLAFVTNGGVVKALAWGSPAAGLTGAGLLIWFAQRHRTEARSKAVEG